MNAYPPIFWSTTFNDAAFQRTNYLTKDQTDSLYISLNYFPPSLGTATAGKCLITDLSNSIQGINQIGFQTMRYGGTLITSSAAEINYLDGSVPGTASASNAVVLDSSRDIKNINNITNTGTLTINGLASINSSFRITTAGTFSSGSGLEMNFSTGTNISNIYSYNRSTSTYLKINMNDLITIDKANNVVNTTAICGFGSSISLNDSVASATFACVNSNKTTYIQSPQNGVNYAVMTLNQYGIYMNPSTGSPSGTCNANCLLDFGSKASPCSINLFGGTYSISANNSSLQLCTGGSTISFWNGSAYDIGTYIASFSSGGSLTTNSGVRVLGSNAAGYSGSGLELEYSGGVANIFAYNRSSLLYRPMTINNMLYFDGLGHLGVNQAASTWVMDVNFNNQTVSSYGYLNSAGSTGFSGSSGSVSFSARFNGRIAVGGEVDVFSDIRVKSNIRSITEEEACLFVEHMDPKYYVFKPETHNDPAYGYLAQDLGALAQKNSSDISLLITPIPEPGLPEMVSHDGFVSPADTLLTINYQKIVALLHVYINRQQRQIAKNSKIIEELINKLSKK